MVLQTERSKQMSTELSPRLAIESILKSYHQGSITRKEASVFIKNVLINIPPMQEAEDNS